MFFLLNSRRALVGLSRNSSSLVQKSSIYFTLHFSSSTSKQKPQSVKAAAAAANPSVVSDFLIQKHQISPQVASRFAFDLPSLKRKPKNLYALISFLQDNGFSKTQLEKLIETRSQMLSASLEHTLKPKFKFFRDFGFSNSEIAEIVVKDPTILNNSLSRMIAPAFSVLKGLLGSTEEVKKLLLVSTWFLSRDLEKILLPNINYLTSCGIKMDQIRRFLPSYGRFFLLKPEVMKQLVDRADQLGADRSSGLFLPAVRVVGSMSEEIWERKLQEFHELGFSGDDISRMFRKMPVVFTGSLEKVKKIKEILLATGKYSMESIVQNPRALMSSVEKMYKPRLSVLEVLESKKLINEWPALSTLHTLTDEKFFKRYVAPHLNGIVVRSGSFFEIAEILETRLK